MLKHLEIKADNPSLEMIFTQIQQELTACLNLDLQQENNFIKILVSLISQYKYKKEDKEHVSIFLNCIYSHICASSQQIKHLYGNDEIGIITINRLNQVNLIIKNTVNKIKHTDTSQIYEHINYKKELEGFAIQQTIDASFRDFLFIFRCLLAEKNISSKTVFISHAWQINDDTIENEKWLDQFVETLHKHLVAVGLNVDYDKEKSGVGTNLVSFMNKLDKAQHVLIICCRTMKYKFEVGKYTGVVYEYLRYMENQRKRQGENYLMPMYLNEAENAPGLVGTHAAVSVYSQGYVGAFFELVQKIYGLGEIFWQELVERVGNDHKLNNYLQFLPDYMRPNNIEKIRVHFTKIMPKEMITPLVESTNTNIKQSNLAELVIESSAIFHSLPSNVINNNNNVTTGNSASYLRAQFPRICNVNRPTIHFVGRDVTLKEVKNSINPSVTTIHVITGMGGIGKTTFIKKYIENHANCYEVIWSFEGSKDKILEGYKNLAKELNEKFELNPRINVNTSDIKLMIHRLSGVFKKLHSWCLCFDDVKLKENDFLECLPREIHIKNGHIIISSRDRNWMEAHRVFELEKLLREESVQLLSSIIKHKSLVKKLNSDEVGYADSLAEKLGDLPLALIQAGAYINICGKSLLEYVVNLNNLEQRNANFSYKRLTEDNKRVVKHTWTISIDQIKQEKYGKLAITILNFCAFLSPYYIPRLLFTVPANRDSIALDAALELLSNYSLISMEQDNTISIHPLVQVVLQDEMCDVKKEFLKECLHYFNQAFPQESDSQGRLPLKKQLTKLIEHAEEAEIIDAAEFAISAFNLGIIYYVNGNYRKAEKRLIFVYQIAIKSTIEGLLLELICGYLVKNCLELNKINEAREYCSIELKESLRKYTYYSKEVAGVFINQGNIFIEEEQYENAINAFENSLWIYSKLYKENKIKYNYKAVLKRIGIEAEAICQELYTLNRFNEGCDVAFIYIGICYYDLKNYDKAKEYFLRTLIIRNAIYADNHGYLATPYNNLGALEISASNPKPNLKLAIALLNESIDIQVRCHKGDNDNAISNTLNNLGYAYILHEEYDLALIAAERSLKILRSFPELRSYHARALSNKGHALAYQADKEEGLACLKLALEIYTELKNDDSIKKTKELIEKIEQMQVLKISNS